MLFVFDPDKLFHLHITFAVVMETKLFKENIGNEKFAIYSVSYADKP